MAYIHHTLLKNIAQRLDNVPYMQGLIEYENFPSELAVSAIFSEPMLATHFPTDIFQE